MRELSLSERLKRFRNKTGWSQKRLGEALGLAQWQVSHFELHRMQPTPFQEKRIKRLLLTLTPFMQPLSQDLKKVD